MESRPMCMNEALAPSYDRRRSIRRNGTLVALRIALGLTQRQLAERLSVNESQISRDERNEYQGVTVDRASRILDALGVTLKSAFQAPVRLGGAVLEK